MVIKFGQLQKLYLMYNFSDHSPCITGHMEILKDMIPRSMKSPAPKEESPISSCSKDVTAYNIDERSLFAAGGKKMD